MVASKSLLFLFHVLRHPVFYYSAPVLKYWESKFCNVLGFSYVCRLVTGGIPEGHFTHVFVDEAGHAVETECLVPLAGKENKLMMFSVMVMDLFYVLHDDPCV